MIKNRIILFIFILSFLVPANLVANDKTDSLIDQLRKEQSGEELLKTLLEIAKTKVNKNDVSALQYAERALQVADSLGKKFESGAANEYIGKSWKLLGDHTLALDYLFDALRQFKLLDRNNEAAEIMRSIGETYRASSRYDMATQYLDEALKLFGETNDELGKGRTYDRFAAVCLELLYHHIDEVGLRNSFNNAQVVFDEYYNADKGFRSLFDSTETFSNMALAIAKAQNNNELMISAYLLLGTVNAFANRMNVADEYLQSALSICAVTEDFPDLSLVYINIASYYEKRKNPAKAIYYAKMAYDLAVRSGILVYIKYSAFILSSSYEKYGDYKSSRYYLEKAFEAHDKIFSQNLNVKLASLKNRFELERKEIELDRSQTTVRYQLVLFGSIVALLFVIFAILFFKNKSRKKTNDELNKKNQIISEQKNSLEESNATKDKFFSIIAHDLRSPIASFLQIAEMFDTQSELLTDEDRVVISRELHKSARNVYTLLENLLTWSRIQRNVIEPNFQCVRSDDLLENISSEVLSMAKQKNIDLKVCGNRNTLVYVDLQMILTVLRNLLSNAIKFTNRGGQIVITAKDESDDFLLIEVEDNGIGISEANRESLFSITKKNSKPGTEGEPSTGLGLVLCREFVGINNGSIWVESEMGKGACFKFTVPKYHDPESDEKPTQNK